MRVHLVVLSVVGCALFSACTPTKSFSPYHEGVFKIYDERAERLFDLEAKIETLAKGFIWSEGPVWVEDLDCLLFSDIPNNKVHKYCSGTGLSTYLEDSGYSNGLILNQSNELVLMQSRLRRVAKLDTALDTPEPKYAVLADNFENQRLNSPNDVALHSSGALYFTDPPYGLAGQLNDPEKDLSYQGVYRLKDGAEAELLDDKNTYPNGITFSNKEDFLFVAVSDVAQPVWYRYDVTSDGLLKNRALILDSREFVEEGYVAGLPDGMETHSSGYVFATGPGGVWVFDTEGALMARVLVPNYPVSNIAFDSEESAIYLTAESHLLRVALKAK